MTHPDVVIRPPAEQDARRLAEVHIAAWRAAYRGVMTDEFLDGLDAERKTEIWLSRIIEPLEGFVCLVADAGGEVAGFVIVGPPDGDAEPGTGKHYAINLHPDFWAQGIGTALIKAAEDQLVQLGYSRAFLWVEQNNDRAIRFYTSRGWEHDGGIQKDTSFDPPVMENRHSRTLLR
ncbi:GNAT family N-acetyltransferase [Arthrobacter monumenti]